MTGDDMVLALAKVIEDNKGEGVVVLDVGSLNSWTNYFVIATSNSSQHMRALLDEAKRFVEKEGITILRPPRPREGEEWALLDAGDIVVHIMTREAREFYALEELWHKARRLK